MNDYNSKGVRDRGNTLLIVEGNHEKNVLIKKLIYCFPEVDIDFNNIYIYGTNIYLLYDVLENEFKEYDENWDEIDDINLPKIIGNQRNEQYLLNKSFTNILIFFDYERHDPKFDERKINRLQKYFNDVYSVGQLYINYPMIESYLDFSSIPDNSFLTRVCSANMTVGTEYKNLHSKKLLTELINFPDSLNWLLKNRYQLTTDQLCENCVNEILLINSYESSFVEIENILSKYLTSDNLKTAKYDFHFKLKKLGYIIENKDYFSHLREQFVYIIKQNILKAYKIQVGECNNENPIDIYFSLQFDEVLEKQNIASRDKNHGFIWVLNTLLMFIPEFNTNLII